MKGLNDLILNRATMRAAVQHYIDTVLFAVGQAPKVLDVVQSNGSFRVSVGEKEAAG